MYTISQTSMRTGLSIATIRAWERRYGVVQPARTPAGYRLYDDAAIDRLIAMRGLIDGQGWRPRQAADRIMTEGWVPAMTHQELTQPELTHQELTHQEETPPHRATIDRPGSETVIVPSPEGIGALLEATHRLDIPAMERVLDEQFAAERFELAMERVVFPALRAIGEAWAAGTIDVAKEHAASETIRRRLARFFDAAGVAGSRPQVIVGAPPGTQHELGAFAFAVACRRAGLSVLYLGANVPLASWVSTVRETTAPVVVMAVVTHADVPTATSVINAVAKEPHAPTCLVGGASAGEVPKQPGTIHLAQPIEDSVAAVLAILELPRHPGIPPRLQPASPSRVAIRSSQDR